MAGLSQPRLSQADKTALSGLSPTERKVFDDFSKKGVSFDDAYGAAIGVDVKRDPFIGKTSAQIDTINSPETLINGLTTFSTDLPVELQISAQKAGLSLAEIGGVRDRALSLQNHSKDFLRAANLFEINDLAFAEMVEDLRSNGFDSEFAVLGDFNNGIRNADNEYLANLVSRNKDTFIEGIRKRAGIADALAKRVLTVNPEIQTGNRAVDALSGSTIAFFADPQAAGGGSLETLNTIQRAGLIDYKTYDQLAKYGYEKAFNSALTIASLGSLVANPKALIDGVKGLAGLGRAAVRLGLAQSKRLVNIFSGKFRSLTDDVLSRFDQTSNSRGFVSGDVGEIGKKLRLARTDIDALAEINAAKALRADGINVHFRTAAGDLGIKNVRTSDFFVGGAKGSGRGGNAFDVFSPKTGNAGRVVSQVGSKLSQADRVVLNLDNTKLTIDDLSNIIPRVNNIPNISRPLQEVIFVQNQKVIGRVLNNY